MISSNVLEEPSAKRIKLMNNILDTNSCIKSAFLSYRSAVCRSALTLKVLRAEMLSI